jgi:hypothetical protein
MPRKIPRDDTFECHSSGLRNLGHLPDYIGFVHNLGPSVGVGKRNLVEGFSSCFDIARDFGNLSYVDTIGNLAAQGRLGSSRNDISFLERKEKRIALIEPWIIDLYEIHNSVLAAFEVCSTYFVQDRQFQLESGSFADLATIGDAATVGRNDVFDNCQAQTGTDRLAGGK